jgi:hypothetical protein
MVDSMISPSAKLAWEVAQLQNLCGLNSVSYTGRESFEEIQALLTIAGFPTTFNFPVHSDVFSDGSNGALNFDGTSTILGLAPSSGVYTLNNPLFATTVTVQSGVTVKTANWPIFATKSITVLSGGTIDNSGSNGTATAAGVNASGLYTGSTGGAGATGAGLAGVGGGSGFGSNTAGAGGAGSSGAGGAGGATLGGVWPYRLPGALTLGILLFASTVRQIGSVSGGGGGGGDGTNKGGYGASSGGLIALIAPSIINLGTISANGGNGGTPTVGNCGGGGAGSGGIIIAKSSIPWTAGTTSVVHGTGGSPVGTGVAGTNGGNGSVTNIVI